MVATTTLLALVVPALQVLAMPKISHSTKTSNVHCEDSRDTLMGNVGLCCPGVDRTENDAEYCCVMKDHGASFNALEEWDDSNCVAKVSVDDDDYDDKVAAALGVDDYDGSGKGASDDDDSDDDDDDDDDSAATMSGVAKGVIFGAVAVHLGMSCL